VLVGIYAGFKTELNETITTNFKRLLATLTTICNRFDNIIIGGDFNADLSRNQCPKSKRLEIWQLDNGLVQHVVGSTRIREASGTIQQPQVDHVFTKSLKINKTELFPSEVSDHVIMSTSYPALDRVPPLFFEKILRLTGGISMQII
jgi:endonuclease/exonuclease/phosphatase (EEP) superfamily protein YafD